MKKIVFAIFILLVTFSFFIPIKSSASLEGLPIQLSSSKGTKDEVVIYLTGDGGWNKFSQKLTHEIENEGYGVVSLNTRKYFRMKKTPESFARDIEILINSYMNDWGKSSVIIIGYSFGADVAAFLPKRLPDSVLSKLKCVALLSPSISTDFVINLKDLIGDSRNTKRKYKIGPELTESKVSIICIFGINEDLKLKNTPVKSKNVIIHKLPGNHHYLYNTELVIQKLGL
jgi:type IV secretory pathway VirJ component